MTDHHGNDVPEQPYEPFPMHGPPGAPGGSSGAGGGPEYRAPEADATRRGVIAALTIFGIVVAMHLILLAGVKLSGDHNNAWLFLPEGVLVVVAALVAAIVVTTRLPQQSRTAFWAVGAACMFLSFIIWGATCAVAL
jgi:hypothetical protein